MFSGFCMHGRGGEPQGNQVTCLKCQGDGCSTMVPLWRFRMGWSCTGNPVAVCVHFAENLMRNCLKSDKWLTLLARLTTVCYINHRSYKDKTWRKLNKVFNMRQCNMSKLMVYSSLSHAGKHCKRHCIATFQLCWTLCVRVPVIVFVRAVKADDQETHCHVRDLYLYVFIVEALCITPTVNVCICDPLCEIFLFLEF